MISIRHGWRDNKKQNCRLLNQYSSERTARVQIIADSNCILLFFQSLKAKFQKQKKLPRVRHNMRNRRLSWTRASKMGKRARTTGGKAATSFICSRRKIGGVRNVRDVCIVWETGNVWNVCGRPIIGGVRNVRDVCVVCGTGNVWNIFDVCGTRNIGSIRGMSDIRCVCRLAARCAIRDNRTGCAMCRLLFFRQWPLLYVTWPSCFFMTVALCLPACPLARFAYVFFGLFGFLRLNFQVVRAARDQF